ncbi:conserved hypothetical protein [Gammaproteobacteria bacterium]
MAIIQTISPETATGEIAAIYDQMKKMMGFVPSAMQMRSSSPFMLEMQMRGLGYYMQHPTLSMSLLACVRMLVSQKNDCAYCIDLNAGLLINMMGWTIEQVAATRADPSSANLPEKDKAMLLFVLKGVGNSLSIEESDLDALRALGWSDSDILDGLGHGAQMVAGDILINTFKVEKDFPDYP